MVDQPGEAGLEGGHDTGVQVSRVGGRRTGTLQGRSQLSLYDRFTDFPHQIIICHVYLSHNVVTDPLNCSLTLQSI